MKGAVVDMISLAGVKGAALEVTVNEGAARLVSVQGLLCALGGHGRSQDPVTVSLAGERTAGLHWALAEHRRTATALDLRWRSAAPLELAVHWELRPDTGVLTRRDTITSLADKPLVLRRVLSTMCLQAGVYDIYCQSSRWATENQGAWVPLHSGSIVLRGEEGRTTQGSTPYACVRDRQSGRGLAIHVVPCGNWVIRVSAVHQGNNQACCMIEAGLSDEDLELTLAPGELLKLPELLVQGLADGRPESAAAPLHRHMLATTLAGAKPQAPVVWNTWIDQFDNLDVERLRGQLAVVKELGCEALVIDAGWFGEKAGKGAWFELAGDWRECTERAFRGRMREFADEVRAAGLGFGLWMEPEHVGRDAPVRREHPEWFKGGGANPRIDLENPAAYGHVKSEICRLVETYGLAWMKIDFNIPLGHDESGSELSGYYRRWYALLDEVRAKYPATFFEGCSSGGMRLDLNSLAHHDDHFLSDTCHPVDTIRIAEGAMLRLPPGRVGKWLVMRSIGRTIPDYPGTVADAPESLAVQPASGWQPRQLAETFDLHFAAIAAMAGVFGLSGDPMSMSQPARAELAGHIAFYKRWRRFIMAAHGHLLTEVRPIGDRSGWSALQLSNSSSREHLVFAYRLMDSGDRRRFRLVDLDPAATYEASVHPRGRRGEGARVTGASLMADGLDIQLPHPASASVTVLRPV